MDAAVLTIRGEHLRADVVTVGAGLVGLWCPDAAGRVVNVVLRLDDVEAYRDPARNPYLGSWVGRYANRIAGARFRLDGVEHRLSANEGSTCLHGGAHGWSFRDWEVVDHGEERVALRLVSPDGDQGFPGRVDATVSYRIDGWELVMEAEATVTAPTPLSMTNHAYWNLAGEGSVDRHRLEVGADRVLEVDGRLIPTGAAVVLDGELDLRGPTVVGARRLDHCFWPSWGPPTSRLSHPGGRALELHTDQPALQVYTGDGLGPPFGPRAGICLEPQQLPDAPNRSGFPPAVVGPGDAYRHRSTYRFSPTGGLLAG